MRLTLPHVFVKVFADGVKLPVTCFATRVTWFRLLETKHSRMLTLCKLRHRKMRAMGFPLLWRLSLEITSRIPRLSQASLRILEGRVCLMDHHVDLCRDSVELAVARVLVRARRRVVIGVGVMCTMRSLRLHDTGILDANRLDHWIQLEFVEHRGKNLRALHLTKSSSFLPVNIGRQGLR